MDAPETSDSAEAPSPSRSDVGLAWVISLICGFMVTPMALFGSLLSTGAGLRGHSAPVHEMAASCFIAFLIPTLLGAGVAGSFWNGRPRQLGIIGTAPCVIIYPVFLFASPLMMILGTSLAVSTAFGVYYYSARFFQRKTGDA